MSLLPYTLQSLVNLSRINIIPLNDIEDGYVTATARSRVGRDHNVLGLCESSHDIEHSRFSDALIGFAGDAHWHAIVAR